MYGECLSYRVYARWWSGGVSGAMTQAIVAPFDLLETRMMFLRKDITMYEYIKMAIHRHGVLSLYDGLSAQILRQLTYTTLRFHLYDVGKRYLNSGDFFDKVCVASAAGLLAGVVGIPCELINTRMHVDRLLLPKHRRNYNNVFHGLYCVFRYEGFKALYTGGISSLTRSTLVNIGQNAIYDQCKLWFMRQYKWEDDFKILHLLSSLAAAVISGPLVQPFEIIKTMEMNKSSGQLTTPTEKFSYMMRFGIRGLFRGITPNMCRIIPQTILMILIYEQLRLNYGAETYMLFFILISYKNTFEITKAIIMGVIFILGLVLTSFYFVSSIQKSMTSSVDSVYFQILIPNLPVLCEIFFIY